MKKMRNNITCLTICLVYVCVWFLTHWLPRIFEIINLRVPAVFEHFGCFSKAHRKLSPMPMSTPTISNGRSDSQLLPGTKSTSLLLSILSQWPMEEQVREAKSLLWQQKREKKDFEVETCFWLLVLSLCLFVLIPVNRRCIK